MLTNLLLHRMVIFNAIMGSLFAWMISKGWVGLALASDPTGITILVAIAFILVSGSMSWRAWKVAKAMNWLKNHGTVASSQGQPWTKRDAKNKHLDDASKILTVIGLFGTLIGFVIMLSGLDIGSLTEVSGVKILIPQMMTGMKVAIYTTLAGLFFGTWNSINYRMLNTATTCLNEDEKAILDV